MGKKQAAKHAPDGRKMSKEEVDLVMGCWNDVQNGKFGSKPTPGNMEKCMKQRTKTPPPCDVKPKRPIGPEDRKALPDTPDQFMGTHEDVLIHNKKLYDDGHADTVAAVELLVALAKEYAAEEDDTVTSKKVVPPTGDKRTYVSLSTYCWPANPDDWDHPEGPWTCKDGHAFPGRHHIAPDFQMLVKLMFGVYRTGLAYYFTEVDYFAERTATKIRKFFLDPETGMLPSLLYAQLKPGMSDVGSSFGTIDMKNVSQLFDAIAMIRGSEHWTDADEEALKKWMTEYVEYLKTDHVKPEMCSINNHGTYFDVQYVAVLMYLGRREEAAHHINTLGKDRMKIQIYGSMMPNELIRPKSYAYFNLQLEAMTRLALQAEKLGINLWDFRSETYDSLMDAWDWMGPHWCDRSMNIWPVEQMENPVLENNRPACWMGAVYHRTRSADGYTKRGLYYAQLWQQLKSGHDPHKEVLWDVAILHHLPLVYMDDCFMTTCPDRDIIADSPEPSYSATCAPTDGPIPYVTAYDPRVLPKTVHLPHGAGKPSGGGAADDSSMPKFVHSAPTFGQNAVSRCIGGDRDACMYSMHAGAPFVGVLFLLVATVMAYFYARKRVAKGGRRLSSSSTGSRNGKDVTAALLPQNDYGSGSLSAAGPAAGSLMSVNDALHHLGVAQTASLPGKRE